MKFFGGRSKRSVTVVEGREGFIRGQIVRHKMDGVRVLIVGFDCEGADDDSYGPVALCAFSSKPGDETPIHLSELEPLESGATVGAVDPVDGISNG